MVNTTQFYKTKIALAVVLGIGLSACGDSEGDAGSTTTSTSTSASQTDATQNTVGNQDELTGTVTGVVQDTNGNPVVGAAVFLAGAETTTDAGGVYVFTDVSVVNVEGVNNEGGESTDQIGTPLVLTIAAEGHMGATVTVTPEAQVNNTGGTGDTSGSNSTATVQTYIDGFTAQAGTAQLPAISKRVYGYLRDCATNGPLVGGTVAFDFIGVNDDGNSSAPTDVALGTSTVNNASGDYTAITDADGMFDVILPADSTLKFLVNGFLSTDSDGNDFGSPAANTNISTADEQIDSFLGTVEVCAVEFEEEPAIAPLVTSIDGQIGTTTTGVVDAGKVKSGSLDDHDNDPATADTLQDVDAKYAALNQGVVNDFVINFSKEMASTFDLSEARVKIIAPGTTTSVTVEDATVTLSTDGKSATVSFVEDLAENTKVDVWFPHWTATDASDNLFIVDNSAIVYDQVGVGIGDKASYTHVYFFTFIKPSEDGSASLGTQVIDEVTGEDGPTAVAEALAEYSSVFADNIDGDDHNDVALSQLNGDSNTQARLIALGNAITSGIALTGEIVTDLAVIDYATTGGTPEWTLNGVSATPDSETAATTTRSAFAEFDGAVDGDEVTLTPTNEFGDVLTALTQTAVLVDGIAPTTVLQESYLITNTGAPKAGSSLTVTADTFNARFGSGGEVSSPDTGAAAQIGNPVIYVQPRHLDGQDDRNEEFDVLAADMANRLSAADITAGAVNNDVVQSTITDGSGAATYPLYDATAFTNWAAVPAEIGVAFSENLVAAAGTPTYTGTAGLVSNFVINNDVDDNIDDVNVDVDLVNFDTTDVMALANDDAGAMLGFTGAYSDGADTVNVISAESNANVMIQDAMPPMVTAARWTGTTLVVEFNEAPVIDGDIDLFLSNPVTPDVANTETINVDADATAGTAGAIVQTGNELVITLNPAQIANIAGLFKDGDNGEFLYEEDGDALTEENHAILNWNEVEDATGNSWQDFTPPNNGSTTGGIEDDAANIPNRWQVVSPRFLAYNDVGAFTVTYAYAGLAAGAGPDADGFTASITFSHPLDFGSVAPAPKTRFVEKADGDNDDVFFENVADIQRLLVLDIDANGNYDAATEAFPAGTTAAFITSGGQTRLDVVVPAGLSVDYGVSILTFASNNATVNDITDLSDGDTYVLGDAISSLTSQSRSVSDVINN